jgi:hypothetical protein
MGSFLQNISQNMMQIPEAKKAFEDADWTREAGTTPGSGWDAVQRDFQKYGIEAVANASRQGLYGDYSSDPQLGGWIAARQREAHDNNDLFGINHLTPGGVVSALGIGLGLGGISAGMAGAGAAGAGAGAGAGSGYGMAAGEVAAGQGAGLGIGQAAGLGSGFSMAGGEVAAGQGAGLGMGVSPEAYGAGAGINYNNSLDYNASGGGTADPRSMQYDQNLNRGASMLENVPPTSETGFSGFGMGNGEAMAGQGYGLGIGEPTIGSGYSMAGGEVAAGQGAGLGIGGPEMATPAAAGLAGDGSSGYGMANGEAMAGAEGEAGLGMGMPVDSPWYDKLQGAYKQIKDPLSLGSALHQMYSSSRQRGQMQAAMNASQNSGFDHKAFQGLANDYMDPQKRLAMMQSMPAFQASQDYLSKDQQRKLAKGGSFSQAGQGGQISNNWSVPMLDVLGKNAQTWDNQLFGQIKDASGMGFNNQASTDQLAGAMLPSMMNNQNDANKQMWKAITANWDSIPDAMKKFLA